jgi:LPXTG-site transpeptidase (sortase) family protein
MQVVAMHSTKSLFSRTGTRVVLSIVLVALACGLFAWDSDFMLALELKLNRHDRPTYATRLQSGTKPLHAKIVGDRVVADAVSIDSQLFGGSSSAGPLAKGAWIDPHGSTPGGGQPIVIAGHRTTGHFATLHLIKRGQPVIVYWKGKEYDYIVTGTHAISGDAGINIQKDAPGTGERLVLYTCLPRWKGDKRNVVIAVPYVPKKK